MLLCLSIAALSFSVTPTTCGLRIVQRSHVHCMAELANAPGAETGAPPAEMAPAEPPAEVKGVVQPMKRSRWEPDAQADNEFRHGAGDRPLAMSTFADGTSAMIVPTSTPAPASAPAIAPVAQGDELATATTLKPPPMDDNEFRHGAGGKALAMTTAIDGSVAMIVPTSAGSAATPAVTPAATSDAVPQSVEQPAASSFEQPTIGGGISPAVGPMDDYAFRFGPGGQALGMGGNFRHGTPAARRGAAQ